MIYLISDPHGGESTLGIERFFERSRENDLLIILGDLSLYFDKSENNMRFSDEFLKIKRNIAFVDGNHENFDHLYSFKTESWCGGEVHRLSDTIVHLKRGHIFEIDGKSFFVFGGCKSSAKWKPLGLWYPEEEATEAEIQLAYDNLQNHGNKVDYVLTHKYKKNKTCGFNPAVPFEKLCEFVDTTVEFKHWYAGHCHENYCYDEKHTIVYDDPSILE